MATDLRFYYGSSSRRPFNLMINSADARANGVEVVPAIAGATIYLEGYTLGNDTGGALTFTLVNDAGAAGYDDLTPDLHVPTVTTLPGRYDPPLSFGAGRNAGIG